MESRWRLGYISQKAVTSHGTFFPASWVRCGVTTLCIDFLMPWPFLGFVGRCLSTCPGSQSTLLFFPGLYSPYMYVCMSKSTRRTQHIHTHIPRVYSIQYGTSPPHTQHILGIHVLEETGCPLSSLAAPGQLVASSSAIHSCKEER